MLQPFNQPRVTPFMAAYIQRRVSMRAAYISGRIALDLEIRKPPALIGIEDRYRTDKIKRIERRS